MASKFQVHPLILKPLNTRQLILAALSTQLSSQRPQAVLQQANELTQLIKDSKTSPQEILLSVKDGLSTMPTDLVIHDTSLNHWSLGKALELAKVKAMELDLPQVALDIEIWVKAHPWKAAFYLASAIGFFAPEILSLPALEALGFGVAGVRAGTLTLISSVFAAEARVLIEVVDV